MDLESKRGPYHQNPGHYKEKDRREVTNIDSCHIHALLYKGTNIIT